MKAISYSFLCFFSLVCLSCEKENCGSAELATVPSQPLVTRPAQHSTPNGTQTFVINSKSELAPYGGLASNADTVNFTRYTLLGGISSRNGGVFVGAQSVTVDCQGTYTYSVTVGDGATLAPSTCLFGVLVPKLSSNTKVKFNVTE
jgi:hypothetical protein